MSKKILRTDSYGNVIEAPKINNKSTPKKYMPGGIIEQYIHDRDMAWLNDNPPVCAETKELIRQKYNL